MPQSARLSAGGGPRAIWAMPKWTAIFLWWGFPQSEKFDDTEYQIGFASLVTHSLCEFAASTSNSKLLEKLVCLVISIQFNQKNIQIHQCYLRLSVRSIEHCNVLSEKIILSPQCPRSRHFWNRSYWPTKGSHHFKKFYFAKKFHKTVTHPPIPHNSQLHQLRCGCKIFQVRGIFSILNATRTPV